MTTGKAIALTRQTFVGKVMSLLFNRLSVLVTALVSWLACLDTWALIWFSAVPWKALLPPANWLTPRTVCALLSFPLLTHHVLSLLYLRGRGHPPTRSPNFMITPWVQWLIYPVFFAPVRLPDSPTGYSFCLRNLQSGRLRATFWHQNYA